MSFFPLYISLIRYFVAPPVTLYVREVSVSEEEGSADTQVGAEAFVPFRYKLCGSWLDNRENGQKQNVSELQYLASHIMFFPSSLPPP